MRIGLPRCWAASEASGVKFVLISEALISRSRKEDLCRYDDKMSRRRPR